MAALATVVDLQAVTGVEVDDEARADRLLEMASAAIERWCNRTFTYAADDEITIHVDDGVMFLPNGPVTDVSSVTGPSSPWLPTATEVDAAGYAVIQGHVVRRYGWWGCGDYTIVYSHGYQTVPDDIILAVCQMVARHYTNPDGIRSEAIGEASVTYSIPGTGYPLGLTPGPVERGLLAPYRVMPSSVRMVR